MTKYEKKFIESVLRYRYPIVAVGITLLAVLVRYYGKNYLSDDMTGCFLPWYEYFKTNGVPGLKEQVGDYNLIYQTILALMARTNYQPVYMIKMLGIVFDFVLAGVFVSIIRGSFNVKDKNILLVAYASVLLLPTAVLNSAYWGQTDAVYTVFVLSTLALLYMKKYPLAFIFLGIAFGFKLQSVFILPFIAMLYLNRKDFSFLNILYTVMAFWAVGIVAFIHGRSLMAPLDIYLYQIDNYPKMYFNFPSFWTLFSNDYLCFGNVPIITTATIMLLGVLFLYSRKDFEQKYFFYATWTVWTVLLFLPKMHERYAFPLDILLLLLCFLDKKCIKYAVLSICLSLMTYGIYFGGLNDSSYQNNPTIQLLMTLASAIYTAFYCHFTYHLVFSADSYNEQDHKPKNGSQL